MVRSKSKLALRTLYNNKALRLAVLTGLSSASAYLIASLVPLADPFIAAITGLVAITPTFHNSIKSASAETLGVIIGSVVGMFFINWLGFNVLTLAMLITLAYLLSWGLRLGNTAAVPIGVTMILVCGPLLDDVVGLEGRILGVLIGAACALMASYFVLPGQPHQRALRKIRQDSIQAAELLSRVSQSLSEGVLTSEQAYEWLEESQTLTEHSKEHLEEAKDAVRGAKWSPVLSRKETSKAYKKVKNLHKIIFSVNSICEDLTVYAENNKMSKKFSRQLGDLFRTTCEHIIAETEEVDLKTGKLILSNTVENQKRETIETVKDMDETQAIILGGSIARDVTRIRESLK